MAAKNDTLRLPVQIRSERFRSYDVNDFAPATNRDQEWKNTPLDRAEPLMGELDGSRYSFGWDAPAGVSSGGPRGCGRQAGPCAVPAARWCRQSQPSPVQA